MRKRTAQLLNKGVLNRLLEAGNLTDVEQQYIKEGSGMKEEKSGVSEGPIELFTVEGISAGRFKRLRLG